MNDTTTDEENNSVSDDWATALEEQSDSKGTGEYETAEFDNLSAESTGSIGDRGLEMILDIPVNMSVEIGRTRINISNLLKLNQGSIVELDRIAGEPMDVMVNGTLIAHGEVVVINEKFGIRLTDIITPSERVKNLK